MEAQLQILRDVAAGKLAATPETLRRACNRELLRRAAVREQQAKIDATLRLYSTEQAELERQVAKRQAEIDELDRVEFAEAEPREPRELPVSALQRVVTQLCDSRLTEHGLDRDEAYKVIWRLIETTAKGEPLVVPKKLKTVRYLLDLGLIRAEDVGISATKIDLL